MSAVTIYGLANCDTTKKALKWLERRGVAVEFVDYRAKPIAADLLKAWAAKLGWTALINRQSTTWRQLPEPRKQAASDPEFVVLVRDHPQLVKRPVLVRGDEVVLGFTNGLYEKLFAA